MEHLSTTLSASVTIGRETRQYFAFVTTPPDVGRTAALGSIRGLQVRPPKRPPLARRREIC